jgi:hypothetical protein
VQRLKLRRSEIVELLMRIFTGKGAKRDSTNITPRQKAAYVLGEAADVQDVRKPLVHVANDTTHFDLQDQAKRVLPY